MFKKKYYCIQQHDIKDCGAACLATIAKQFGLSLPVAKIREIAGTDNDGTNMYGMVTAAETMGFSAKAVKGDEEAFLSGFPLPAVAHMVMEGSLLHYVVIQTIDRKKNVIIIADPAKGIVKYTMEKFFQRWTGALIILTPTASFKKGNETKGLFKRFLGLLIPQKRFLIHIIFTSIIYTLLGVLGAFYFKFLMDDIIPGGLNKTLHVISLGIILLHLFQVALSAFRTHLMLYLSQKIDIPMMLGYYNHVLDLPMSFFGTRKTGEIVSRFMDASHIREAISGATLTIIIDTMMTIIGGIVLYSYNSQLFSIAVLLLALDAALVYAFNKPINEINRKEMEESAQLTSFLVESLNGIQTIKALNAEREAKYKTERSFIKLLNVVFKMGKLENLRHSLADILSSVGGIVILWVGVWQVLKGELSLGQLLVFNSLLAYFTEPVMNLINLQPILQTAVVASDRLGEILDLEAEKLEDEKHKLDPSTLSGEISFRDVDFRYGMREPVLKNINLTIRKGEKVAFVGESGSGKTTLSKLLMAFYRPEKGEIRIDGTDLRDIKIDALRNRIAYVPQETFLFSGTIRENLALGTGCSDLAHMIEAAKLAQAHDFINELPLRYETRLEENGSNLSGGQRQRLSITRAIMKKPDILILDEATSNLDSITENAVEKTISELSGGMTTVVIAHRLSTVMRCDRIFVMEKGELIECGSHKELMLLKGKYFDLCRGQSVEDETSPVTLETGEAAQ